MFDLEEVISEWRRQMLAAGIKKSVPLDELESHLRDDIRAFVSAGEPEARAFQLAVSGLGSPGSVQTEFNKIKSAPIKPVIIGSMLWIVGTVALAGFLLTKGGFGGRIFGMTLILTLTAGYGAAFVAGIFGIGYVCYRSFHVLSPVRQQSLSRAIFLFNHLAAGLVVIGLLLGVVWTKIHVGRYVGGGGSREPYEIGAWCACAWLIASVVMQRFSQVSERVAVLMCIGGNAIVSLAWFGPSLIDRPGVRGYGKAIYWPLAVFLGVHVCFLMMGLASASGSNITRRV